jgi:hypothetical protein
MPKHVKVYERSDLNSAIEAKGLEAGDTVMYEPDNQMGQQQFKVVQEANGKKSLRLIWDAEMGNLNHNNSGNGINHYTSNNNMNLSNGGRRRAKKSRGSSRRVKKAQRRTRRQARRAH